MLRANLSTRPFDNTRLVRAVLTVLVGLVVIVTAVNVVRFVTLSGSAATLGARAAEAEAEAQRLEAEAVRLRAEINPAEIAQVTAAAREANGIIGRRAFSWSNLFAQFERTLPIDVRITGVLPRTEDDGRFVLAIAADGRSVADLDAFMEALEAEGAFTAVLAVEEQRDETGLVQALIEATYLSPVPAFAEEGS
jgi:Tfp pilus assembly protein PilN